MFNDLFSTVTDSTIYFLLGAIGTSLFLIRLLAMMVFGGGHDADFDVDHDVGADHGSGLNLFSSLSILSFMMGAGWLGLACRAEWEVGPVLSAIYASLFGFSLMLGSSLAMLQMRKFNEAGSYDARHTVGMRAQVYLKIPAKGSGRGQVEVSVDGRRKVLFAVSTGPEIESFQSVKVVGVQGDETLVVETDAT